MNKSLVALLLVAILLLGANACIMSYNYGAEQAALQVVECVKNPTGCELDPSDVPDFDPDESLVPVHFPHRTEISL